MMRIIHVLHSHGYGGAESHALSLMRRQKEAGHEVMYVGPPDGWLARQSLEHGLAHTALAMRGLFDLVSHWRLRRLVARWRPDVVHGHLIRGAWYAGHAVPAGDRARTRVVCTAHATTASKHMGRCDHIIAVCDAVRANLLKHGYADARISVIYNGIPDRSDRSLRTALRAELDIPEGAFAIVNAGRFVHDKGQDWLARVLAQLPPEAHLYFIGAPDTPFGQQVAQQAEGHPRIHFLGYRPDVQRILPAFDAYAVASRREAFSLSIVEACAAELCCVATRVGGIPEAIEHEVTGLLVQPEDEAGMARALTRACQDPALRSALATRARARYLDRFTEQRMVDDTLAVYRAGR